ncbi:MAG: hypothetical protein AB7H77_03445 [Bdellovibrionales bacterium]
MNHHQVASIDDIRTRLTGVIKDWREQTNGLVWPEGDSSMADMDTHVHTLRMVNGQLAVVERRLPRQAQETLVTRFEAASVRDPGAFAVFADAVRTAMAA